MALAPSAPIGVALMALAIAAAELLTIDFPDRRGISLAALPFILAAAVLDATSVVWGAAIGLLVAAIARRGAIRAGPLAVVRGGGAAGVSVAGVGFVASGAMGAADPLRAAPAALLAALLFAGTAELVRLGSERWLGADGMTRVDPIISLVLAPVAVAGWALQERLGPNGLAIAGAALFAAFVFVRTTVNTSTRNAELVRLTEELARTMDALKAAQRDRDDFVNVMTHDLRQPLAGMLGYAQLLERGLNAAKAEERLLKYARGINTGGDRMMRMISNLLDIARMESGQVELETSVVKLEQMIPELIESLRQQIDEKLLEVKVSFDPGIGALTTSEPLLRESVANLIGNAVKYTPEGGTISVNAALEGDHVVVRVTDSGIGIPPDALPHIFQRFFRTGQTEVRELRGSGLGLALTKMMVEKLGGTIGVDSKLGVGSTFTVTMPRKATG